jgi:hypothetical protein
MEGPTEIEFFDPKQVDETVEDKKKPTKNIYQYLVSELRYDPENPLPTTKTVSFFEYLFNQTHILLF